MTIGSQLIHALEDAYEDIRHRHPQLPPEVVFITGTGAKGRRRMRRGHFCPERWVTEDGRRHEVFVAGERLADGPEGVLTTLLHEVAHILAAEREIQDTSRGGRWHNRRFVEVARELGLDYTHERPDSSIGFSDVTMPETTKHAYRLTLDMLEDAIAAHLGRRVSVPASTGTGTSRSLKATCACDRIIRASATVLEGAAITCTACGCEFTQD